MDDRYIFFLSCGNGLCVGAAYGIFVCCQMADTNRREPFSADVLDEFSVQLGFVPIKMVVAVEAQRHCVVWIPSGSHVTPGEEVCTLDGCGGSTPLTCPVVPLFDVSAKCYVFVSLLSFHNLFPETG